MHRREIEMETFTDEQGDKVDQLRYSREWDQLLPPLLEMIQQCLPIPDYFRFPAVCQSWLKVHRDNRCTRYRGSETPWLILFKVPYHSKVPILYNPSEKRVYQIPHLDPVLLEHYHVAASPFGWLMFSLMRNRADKDVTLDHFFLHPISGMKIDLPINKDRRFHKGIIALSAPPSDPNCVIAVPVFDGFALCRIGDQVPHWRICDHPNPSVVYLSFSDEEDAAFVDCIVDVAFYDGRFYGLTGDSDIVILEYPTCEIRKLNMDCRQLPEWPSGICHTSFVVSGGECLLFRASDLNIGRDDDCPPDVEIQVFKADFGSKTWVRVWSLGEKQVFWSVSGSISVDSSSSCLGGGRGDLMYFSHPTRWCFWDNSRCRSPQNRWCLLEHDLRDGATHYYQYPVGTDQRVSYWKASNWESEAIWVSPSLT